MLDFFIIPFNKPPKNDNVPFEAVTLSSFEIELSESLIFKGILYLESNPFNNPFIPK